MTGPVSAPSGSDRSYSPRFRTALVLTGTGTDGAYQAGVLKALTEAGVRLDVVAGHGIGVVGALFAAVDGGARLWGEDGAWASRSLAGHFPIRPAIRALAWAGAAALATVVLPLAVLAAGAAVYLVAFLGGLVGATGVAALPDWYAATVHDAFRPERLPAWAGQAALVLLALVVALLLVAAARGRLRGRSREQGAFWWRVFGTPLAARPAIRFWRSELWGLLAGGTSLGEPDAADLSRRYAELLADNLGQPGFREVLAVVHDLDSRQDLTLAALAQPYRQGFFGRGPGTPWAHRAGETLDLVGVDRDHVVDALAASQCLPAATEAWALTFAPESHWRGETHRTCDRPGAIARVLDDALAAGVEQVVIVSAAATAARPHGLVAPRVDGRGKLGEWLASQEATAVRDAIRAREAAFRSLCLITPEHNPVGPFDMAGAYDERSDRVQGLAELMARGYEDAYRQFVEPVVGGAEDLVPPGGFSR